MKNYFVVLFVLFVHCIGWADDTHFGENAGLETTKLAQSIIEGDISTYIAALIQLKDFSVDRNDILQRETKEGETILDLMIKTERNRKFFHNELEEFLKHGIVNRIVGVSKIDALVNLANNENNKEVMRVLDRMQDLATKIDSLEKEIANLEIQRKGYKYIGAPLYFFNSGISSLIALSFLYPIPTYYLQDSVVSLASLMLRYNMPDLAALTFYHLSDTGVGGGALALGAGMAAGGIVSCKRAFRTSKKIEARTQELQEMKKQ